MTKHLFYIFLVWSAVTAQAAEDACRILYSTADSLPVSLEGRNIGNVKVSNHKYDPIANCGEILFNGSLTKLNDKAFFSTNLKTIILPASLAVVGDSAFATCPNLRRMVFQSPSAPECSKSSLNFGNLVTLYCPASAWEQYKQSLLGKSIIQGHLKKLEHCIRYTNVYPMKENVGSSFNADIVLHTYDAAKKEGVVYFSDALSVVGMEAFKNCKNLLTVILPDSLFKIESGAFENCKSLYSITIPNSLTEVQNRAFAGCTSLTEISVPNAVTYLGMEAFRGCTGLHKVSLGYSLLEIGANCFYQCEAMDTVICHAVIPPLLYTFYVFKWMKPEAKLFVPEQAIDLYKNSDWSKYYKWSDILPLYDVSLSRILCKNDTIYLAATAVNNKSNQPVIIWTSSNNDVAEVNNQGRVVAKQVSEQPVYITATLDNTGLSESVSFVVRNERELRPVTYAVQTESIEHGSITVNQQKAQVADAVQITVTADAGWQVKSVSVTDTKANPIPAYRNLSRKDCYIVQMPASDIIITALITQL